MVWTFLPTPLAHALIDDLDPALTIYYCIDDLASSSPRGAPDRRRAKRRCSSRADLVFVTSERLRERAAQQSSARAPVPVRRQLRAFENRAAGAAAGAGRSGGAAAADRRLCRRPAPVGRSGSARRRRAPAAGCDVRVGRARADRRVAPEGAAQRRHCSASGRTRELPPYVRGFDVGLVPYRLSEYTANVYPTKLNEYLAMGIPVVATDLTEIRRFNARARRDRRDRRDAEALPPRSRDAIGAVVAGRRRAACRRGAIEQLADAHSSRCRR